MYFDRKARRNLARVIPPGARITPPPRGVRFEREVAVTVRDGTTLRASVFRPEAEGRYPVLLCAQPCGKDVILAPAATRFAAVYQRPPRQRWTVRTGGPSTATLTIPIWSEGTIPSLRDQ